MKRARLRYYILISILLHLLLLWLLLQLPSYESPQSPPVAIRVLDPPPLSAPSPKSPPTPPAAKPKPRPTRPPKQGGTLAELPKPQQEARPDDARLVSRYDSRAQDLGPGNSGTHKPSGQTPPQLPPELELPERYSKQQPNQPVETVQPPSPPSPTSQPDAAAPTAAHTPPPPQSQPRRLEGNRPIPPPQNKRTPAELKPTKRQFRISSEQEVASLQQKPDALTEAQEKRIQDQTARLDRPLPLPTFDAPGIYQQGPERPGESNTDTGNGGKFRSIDAFGLKHFSYLIGIQRKIELVFAVPFFSPQQQRIGVPIVGFTIQRDGHLSEAILLRSSGHTIIDRALLEAVRRAAPYNPFPTHLPDQEISIRVYATLS